MVSQKDKLENRIFFPSFFFYIRTNFDLVLKNMAAVKVLAFRLLFCL